jgi:hypothetical protein
MGKVPTTTADVCLSHRSFNLLRRFKRSDVAPRTLLNMLVPPDKRQMIASQFASELGISAPQLVREDTVKMAIFGGALFAGLAAAIIAIQIYFIPWLAMLLGFGLAAWLGVAATTRFRTAFPKSVSTIRALADWVMSHKADLASCHTTAWTREQVVARVRQIVIEILGCEATYREDAQFVKDLGLS